MKSHGSLVREAKQAHPRKHSLRSEHLEGAEGNDIAQALEELCASSSAKRKSDKSDFLSVEIT
jgi:hypothetical protein